jgi:hypothetical protein
MRTIEDALNRLRAEFLEMPGMHLKLEQVQRLCGVERGLWVLDSLVEARFLWVSTDGQYARVTDGGMSSHRSAKTDLYSMESTVYRRGIREVMESKGIEHDELRSGPGREY